MPKKRIACVGMGQRFEGFYLPILVNDYAPEWDIVGLCDSNQGRLALTAGKLQERGFDVPTYTDDAFEQMMAETRPDAVLVTSKDCTHDRYICRAMELGSDAITEKPMTTDEHKCQRIIDMQKKTGRTCTVTFNYRYSPPRTQVKDLLMSGVIGDLVSVDFHWLLDTRHGADYFRRWHRNKANSGGLQVHKATHHFDLINWWLSSVPETVYATGDNNFYGPEMAQRYGLHSRGERCLGCAEQGVCPFYIDIRQYPSLVDLFLQNEEYDGYYRDACVFGSAIDIEDTLHAVVSYQNGVKMSYSLHAFMPWEGYVVALNGSKGRVEHICQETVYFSGDGTVPGELVLEGTRLKVYPHFQAGYELDIWRGEGGHGGGDPALANDLFGTNPPEDPYKRAADHRAGAWSILTGVAVNRSMEWGRPAKISELIRGLDQPDYPPMPGSDEAIDPRPLAKSTAQYTVKSESIP